MIENKKGNYWFLPSGRPYSAGVIAGSGYELIRVTLLQPVPIQEGMGLVEAHLGAKHRPIAALCALELRCPSPHSFSGFAEFNEKYHALLVQNDLLVDGQNPIARTNVAPASRTVSEPSMYAFVYSAPCNSEKNHQYFVVSGAGELLDSVLDPEAIVRPGETSQDALREKAALVLEIMKARLAALSTDWSQVISVHVYTVHNIDQSLKSEILSGIGRANGNRIRWYNARPPISGIEFEMDVRAVGLDCYE